MNSKEPSELRLAAILLWRNKQFGERGTASAVEAIKARDERRIEQFREALQMIFIKLDEISFRINGGCVEAEFEDFRFASLEFPASDRQETLTVVTLLGRCSSCGSEVMSEPIHCFLELGKMLEKFEPIRWHYCYRDENRVE